MIEITVANAAAVIAAGIFIGMGTHTPLPAFATLTRHSSSMESECTGTDPVAAAGREKHGGIMARESVARVLQ
jgi:hypothetical protein